LSLKELANHLELEVDQFLELTNLFLKTAFTELKNLESALEDNDPATAEKMAHSIKGAAGILGFTEIHDVAKKIECAVRKNRFTDINGTLQMIREKLDRIADDLQGEKWNAQDSTTTA
jgi:HPt (histidine-containing phosphotransfer) domain-containing protein